jgi:hypothetical protein
MRWKLQVYALCASVAIVLLFIGWCIGLWTADYLYFHNH